MKNRRGVTPVRLKIFNPAKYTNVDKPRIRTLVRHVLRAEKAQLRDVHVIIVDDTYIAGLNREFFEKSGPTNVIAFDLGDVGEVYVSCGQLRGADDLFYFIVHGLLHLAGYAHDSQRQEKSMHERCLKYLRVSAKPVRIHERGAK